jgi:hypothetical protein
LAEWQTNSSWYQKRRKRLLSAVEFAGGVNHRKSLPLSAQSEHLLKLTAERQARWLHRSDCSVH